MNLFPDAVDEMLGCEESQNDSPHADRARSSFAGYLCAIRKKLFGKQWALASDLGCTQAAVSQWETRRRLPDLAIFQRMLDAFARAGATPDALMTLRAARQCVVERAAPRGAQGRRRAR